MPSYTDTVEITRPWSDWMFLRQQRNIAGGGGFHIHNPWGNSTQPQGSDDRNRLEVGYQTSGGQHLWGQLVIHGPSGRVGIGTVAPSDRLHVAGNVRADDFLVTSDARLKTGIRSVSGAMRKLEQLRCVEFEWTPAAGDEGSGVPRTGVGVIAQEVEAAAPELVRQTSEDGYKAVNLSGMVGMLIEAVKEISAQNRALGLRIAALERNGGGEPTVAASEA
jgi:hypothetical protein